MSYFFQKNCSEDIENKMYRKLTITIVDSLNTDLNSDWMCSGLRSVR